MLQRWGRGQSFHRSCKPGFLQAMPNKSTAIELAQLLFWLMVVGYNLRLIEVQQEMNLSFSSEDEPPLLPPLS